MLKFRNFIAFLVVMAIVAVGFTPLMQAEAQEPVVITWFIGLGAGGQPEQQEVQNAFAEEFNATHDDIQLEIVIVDNTVANDTLSTLIASGEAPDIVGLVGIRGSNQFMGSFLDLDPYLAESDFDTSIWAPELLDFYRVEGEGLIGLPFGIFPSFIYYNVDLFDEAGLDYPPTQFGEPYADGDPWDVDKLTELAMYLTIDAEGNDATMDGFDPENIIQFGYAPQWYNSDLRSALTTPFGAGQVFDAEGNAVMPDNWRAGIEWFYAGMWETRFIPNAAYQNSDVLANGNVFDSGNVAMAYSHLWYTCCLGNVENWNIAVAPSYNGEVTTKMHADTFRILKSTENPEAALTVLLELVTSEDLLKIYGGMPSAVDAQAPFLEENYPDMDWQVAIDSQYYADNPSHESWMPNFNQTDQRLIAFQSLLETDPDLDLDAEIDTLLTELQAIFDEAE